MRTVREIEGSVDQQLEEAAKRKYATKKVGRTFQKLRLDTKNVLHKLEVEVEEKTMRTVKIWGVSSASSLICYIGELQWPCGVSFS